MKTLSFTSNFKRTLKILSVVFFLLIEYAADAQNKLEIGASTSIHESGTGFGASLSPMIIAKKGRNILSVGINVQGRNQHITGVRGRYEYHFYSECWSNAFLFYDVAYHASAYLSKFTIKYKTYNSPELTNYFMNLKLKTIEQYIGFGLNVTITNSFYYFSAVGAGLYNTFNTIPTNLIDREKNRVSLILMTGIRFNIPVQANTSN